MDTNEGGSALARDQFGKRVGVFGRGETAGGGVLWCGVFLNHEWARMRVGRALARDLFGTRVGVLGHGETEGGGVLWCGVF